MEDVPELLSDHHLELAIPLSLLAFLGSRVSQSASERIMPIFFGVMAAPLVGITLLSWADWNVAFPWYMLDGVTVQFRNPLWAALYLPGWGGCALLALLHPVFAKQPASRIMLWMAGVLLIIGQVYLALSSNEMR